MPGPSREKLLAFFAEHPDLLIRLLRVLRELPDNHEIWSRDLTPQTPDSEFEEDAFWEARAMARGMGRSLLVVLQTRGFTVDEAIRLRVEACTDIERLSTWVTRAATVANVAEVFAE